MTLTEHILYTTTIIKFSKSNNDTRFTTTKYSASSHEFLVGADYTPSLSENFKLTIGPYARLSLLKLTDKDEYGSESKTENGFIVGGKIGVIYDFDFSEIEAGLKADKSWHNGDEEWIDVDKISYGGYLSYNFKF